MKRSFAATVWREGKAYVSQCLELGIASQGETEEEALANLKEALELHSACGSSIGQTIREFEFGSRSVIVVP